MPFKSRAQRRKFAELLVQGEISPETYEEWNRGPAQKKGSWPTVGNTTDRLTD
ncbi:MAG TPA: hypothetical protein VGA78_08235 [Gemmatimonadales bacterium]